MSEKRFQRGINLSCVDTETGKSYWYACNLCGLLNVKEDTIQRLEKENQRVYGIIEDGGVLLTRKQLLDVIGEDKCDMFFQDQAIISALKEENEQLKQELRGMNELLKSYRETIKHDAELLADATRNGYLPPLDDFVKR